MYFVMHFVRLMHFIQNLQYFLEVFVCIPFLYYYYVLILPNVLYPPKVSNKKPIHICKQLGNFVGTFFFGLKKPAKSFYHAQKYKELYFFAQNQRLFERCLANGMFTILVIYLKLQYFFQFLSTLLCSPSKIK